MQDYQATISPRQYFYENLSKVIKNAKSMDEINEYFSNPFHQLDKEPFNQNDVNFIKFIRGNLEWMEEKKKFTSNKGDLLYWTNAQILNIANEST